MKVMEQHPIPQQISSYEFRLIGSMTLKQFFKLAGGAIVAFIFYSSHLPFLIKWPLIFGSAGFGAALAFLPVNERPLETYIIAFLKSVFSPTIYLWQKQPAQIDLLDASFKEDQEEEEEEEPIISKAPQLKEFLASLPKKELSQTTPAPKAKTAPKPQRVKEEKETKKETTAAAKPEIKIDLPRPNPPKPTAKPEFGEIPMPTPPKIPNIIVGMVTDPQGKIIEDAIVEIQDAAGNPVRALRTNRLGQFRTATPLANGEYLLFTEKEGYQFDILKLKAEGKIIPPIKIKAKLPNHGS